MGYHPPGYKYHKPGYNSRYWHEHKSVLGPQNAQRHAKTRYDAIQLLGGKCVICGLTDWRMLTINHKEGNGTKDLKTNASGFYRRIVNGGTDRSKLDVRCWNHNILYEYESGRRRDWQFS